MPLCARAASDLRAVSKSGTTQRHTTVVGRACGAQPPAAVVPPPAAPAARAAASPEPPPASAGAAGIAVPPELLAAPGGGRGGGGSAATRCVMATRVPLASVAPATTARFAASAAAKRTHAAPPPATSAHASTAPCGSSSVATWALVAETARPDTTTTRPAGPAPRENRANVVPRTSTATALTVFARRVGDAAASVRRSARAEASSSPSLS